jgi:hypothetical protein
MNKLLRLGTAVAFLIVGQLHFALAQSDNSSIDSSVLAADAMPDVDWINVVGMHWKGRAAVLKAHAVLHKGMFANSRMLTPEITMMREIAPNVIVETHVNRIEGGSEHFRLALPIPIAEISSRWCL